MERRSKVELFEEIRREYEHGVGTIKGVARKLGVHRRMVREALASAIPRERKSPVRAKPKLGAVQSYIDGIVCGDMRAPRKQRHTAHRIWNRLREERPDVSIAESTVRKYVRECKERLGLQGREVFIEQCYGWGAEAQVDWYEARAVVDGEDRRVYLFCMRSMASGGAFHRAYPHASQQAFLEAHELGFRHFGGVFRVLRYDNLSSAVKKILRGYRREETERFIAFRSHWGFASEFCTPGRGHEKGGVEGEAGYFRRNHLVPIPVAGSFDALNRKIREALRSDEARVLSGRSQCIGEAMRVEQDHLLALAQEGFDLAGVHFPRVSSKGTVQVLSNFYSAPVAAGVEVCAKVYAAHVEIWQQGRCVARHERSFGRFEHVLDLDHYLEALLKKPGAMAGSKALEQWRAKGRWPQSFDRYWAMLKEREGRQEGTRSMVELLMMGRQYGYDRLEEAMGRVLELGCLGPDAVGLLVRTPEGWKGCEPVEIGFLSRFDRPKPQMKDYDQLLQAWPGSEVVQ